MTAGWPGDGELPDLVVMPLEASRDRTRGNRTTRHVARVEWGSQWSGGRVNAVLDGSFAQGGRDLRR